MVLDFGGVLYRIDHQAASDAFFRLGLENFDSLYAHGSQSGLMDDLECGKAADKEFLLAMKNRCRKGTTEDEVRKAWNAVLIGLRPEVVKLVTRLSARFDLILFSNTNALHAKHFEEQILRKHGQGFAKAFRQIVYSHRLGHRKPQLKAYREVERRFGLNPATTLFIDDTNLNVLGASKAGWTAVHHEPDNLSLQSLLEQLGLAGL